MFRQFLIIMCLFTMAVGTTLEGSYNSTRNMRNIIAKPGCPTKCGNVIIPYPFGIGSDCSLNNSFIVTCNMSEKPPKLFLGSSNIQILNISDSEVRVPTEVASSCYNYDGSLSNETSGSTRLKTIFSDRTLFSDWTFSISEKNMFTVIGCDDYALIGDDERSFTGCVGLCSRRVNASDGRCSGEGCCQTSITNGLQYYNITLNSLRNHTDIWLINACGYAFLGEVGTFKFHGDDDLSDDSGLVKRVEATVQVVIDWVIDRRVCSANPYTPGNCDRRGPTTCGHRATVCKENSQCYDVDGGYRCKCNQGYEGNPYLDQGCQDINECKDPGRYPCNGDCINTSGSYNCTCPSGSSGDAKTQHGCQLASKGIPWTIIILALVFGLVAILSAVIGIFYGIRKMKLIKLREKFFEQNGGVFLKQKLNAPGTSESMTMFTAEQLRKATDNYSEEKIIGRGGYGVVYKGILPGKRVVAVKKSKLVDRTQAEQFINEVLILTQVIHRNVVKLLGCCLEEEVPVLVYEFISNNTLSYHIHHRLGGASWLSWENRLRVAIEAASALGYLHSQASMPIIHRDVKSTNILLDDNYTTKISDFGASRLVPLDHDQVTTLVQGTLGYLDPEYFHTSQLTDKSDVYSFGVVLAELITGLKPLSADRTDGEKNLAIYFVRAVKENRLSEIVEPRVLHEGTLEQLQVAGDLVKRCLSLHGIDRPTMTEVAMELEGLKRFKIHPWSQNQTYEDLEA